MAGFLNLMEKMPALAQPKQANAKSGASKAADPLGGFIHQLKNREIQPNLNRPALPYTATRSWNA
ncbi:hypothetical protein [Vampirovibrio sp.]|uniref:hypothetical protein n=1 Tax=Vampirovibrio sp. TaxID=2717857 RepID=UPI0035947AB2